MLEPARQSLAMFGWSVRMLRLQACTLQFFVWSATGSVGLSASSLYFTGLGVYFCQRECGCVGKVAERATQSCDCSSVFERLFSLRTFVVGPGFASCVSVHVVGAVFLVHVAVSLRTGEPGFLFTPGLVHPPMERDAAFGG